MAAVIVTNISPLLTQQHLHELFECCGKITTIDFKEDGPGGPYCTIEFGGISEARAAVLLCGTPLGDRPLLVAMREDAQVQTSFDPTEPSSSSSSSSSISTMLQSIANLSSPASMTTPLLLASQKRLDEIARTIYIGNVGMMVTESMIIDMFKKAGEILFVKIAGDAMVRYAFVEYKDRLGAENSMALNGSVLGDRSIKVGKANNPIVKPAGSSGPTVEGKDALQDALRKAKAALSRIETKVDPDKKDKDRRRRSRSRSRRRSKRSRSRSGRRRSSHDRGHGHGHREREREREREKEKEKERERQRESDRRSSPSRNKAKKPKDDRTGMFWDGFQWNPIPPGMEGQLGGLMPVGQTKL